MSCAGAAHRAPDQVRLETEAAPARESDGYGDQAQREQEARQRNVT